MRARSATPRTRATPPAWDAVLQLPFGCLGLRTSSQALLATAYLPPGTALLEPADALAELARQQLLAWIDDPDTPLTLPMADSGTPFQRRVWQLMRQIPRGQTLSYGMMADRLGSAARAVGQACGANPFAPFVPCHRVVAARGLGGFNHSSDADGYLLAVKRWLLRHEGAWHG